jgi:hypothetical protein
MYVIMYVCMCVYVCNYVCMYVIMYVCMYVCVYVCMYVCVYVCKKNIEFKNNMYLQWKRTNAIRLTPIHKHLHKAVLTRPYINTRLIKNVSLINFEINFISRKILYFLETKKLFLVNDRTDSKHTFM